MIRIAIPWDAPASLILSLRASGIPFILIIGA